jgi:hypothetical protein
MIRVRIEIAILVEGAFVTPGSKQVRPSGSNNAVAFQNPCQQNQEIL